MSSRKPTSTRPSFGARLATGVQYHKIRVNLLLNINNVGSCASCRRLGWADQGQIVVSVDPFPVRELLEQGAVETAGGTVVNVLDARLLAQFGRAQAGGQ